MSSASSASTASISPACRACARRSIGSVICSWAVTHRVRSDGPDPAFQAVMSRRANTIAAAVPAAVT
jgi:hypothetical protein